ncbi:MAG: glycoside hydrolase family 25 protein [Candidatus Nanopelagicales bacterium]|nr:glycoside hydrolase family 25 protein [Candidatus Nanopelagicales bacterium]MDZ4250038.1 glycoside hydrolase family 25 protein [Candidatus Nanopelagicales bacterium]
MSKPTASAVALITAAGLLGSALYAGVPDTSPETRPVASDSTEATRWNQQGFKRVIRGKYKMIRGVDISYWNHLGPYPLNIKKLKRAGVRFIFMKASDGRPSVDADQDLAHWWSVDRAAAKAQGILVGGYQYAVPTKKVANLETDAIEQATAAAARVGRLRRGDLPLVLDLELAPWSLSKEQLTSWALTWLSTAHRLTHRKPIIYSYNYFINTRLQPDAGLGKYPFWQAQWTRGHSTPTPQPGMREAKFWQFSSVGRVQGGGSVGIAQDGSANRISDLNVFMGKKRGLLRMAKVPWKKRGKYGLGPGYNKRGKAGGYR